MFALPFSSRVLCVTFKFHNPQPRKVFFFPPKATGTFLFKYKILTHKKRKKVFLNWTLVPPLFAVRSTQVIPRLKTKLHAYKHPERYKVLQSPLTSLEYIHHWPDHNRKHVSKFSRDFSKNTIVFWALCQLHYILSNM